MSAVGTRSGVRWLLSRDAWRTIRWGGMEKPIVRLILCVAAVVAITAVLSAVHVSDRPLTATLTFLFVVLIVSALWGFRYAVIFSLLSAIGFSWLIPPVGSFKIRDPRDLFALAAFLVIGITSSHLSERARREAINANQRRSEAVAAQRRFADLVNSVEGIVWESDAETFIFSFVSQQAERILGYPAEQWLREATFWKDHLHPEDRDSAIQFCQDATARKRSFDSEYRMVAADGRVLWMRNLVTVVVEEGCATRMRGVMVDVTERMRAEEEGERLRQLESDLAHINRVGMMGELAASLGHEIKQPIAGAITNANTCLRWLKRAQPDLEEARDAAQRTIEDAMRAVDIINRTRSLYKKDAPQRVLVNINEVINEIVALLRNEAARYRVTIRTELIDNLPKVMADRVQLQQVLMNLVMNSIDAMKEVDGTREIILTSRYDSSDQLLISVSDTGVGLPTDKNQIFEAFFTTKSHGTGMGLAISRTIIESHGGRLSATSNTGCGATFYFTIPVASGVKA
jgi:PAS domain S-box-containing protein